MYDTCILNHTNVTPAGKEKWSKYFFITEKRDSIFYLPFSFTSDSKFTSDSNFQWLQYRINHHIVTKTVLCIKLVK